MKLHHVLKAAQFADAHLLNENFSLAEELEHQDKTNTLKPDLKGKILATVFYEPSTRTRFSFEAAMMKLGGNVITTEAASHFSSVTKGESLTDTIRIVSGYADAIVLRHFEEGSAQKAAEISPVPLINAGDGQGEHPTQALLDVYTIKKELGRLNNFTIAMVGDLKYGRTIHSLIYLLSKQENVKIYLVSPKPLKLPKKYKDYLKKEKITFSETTDMTDTFKNIDILYMTRVQKERFSSEEEYNKVKSFYILDKNILNLMKKDTKIMHPLPRVTEISPEIDNDPRAAYFRQAKNGLYVRMALLKMLLTK